MLSTRGQEIGRTTCRTIRRRHLRRNSGRQETTVRRRATLDGWAKLQPEAAGDDATEYVAKLGLDKARARWW